MTNKYVVVRTRTKSYVEFIYVEGPTFYAACDSLDAMSKDQRAARTDSFLVDDRATRCSGGIERERADARWVIRLLRRNRGQGTQKQMRETYAAECYSGRKIPEGD